jgi:hypothetical protein
MVAVGSVAMASVQDASIVIDHALNSPTLTIRYSGAHVAMVELRLNGVSYATRNTDAALGKGETNFSIEPSSLVNGDNDVDVRLYDKTGKLLGAEHSTVTSDDGRKAPVFLEMPKMGATVQGPVQITLGFGKDLKNIYASFFIDNQFKSMTNTAPFSYLWDTTHDSNGWHDLEAWVVDDSSSTFKSRKVRIFVNNPGGLTNRQFQPEPTVVPIPKPPTAPTPKTIALETSVPTPTASLQSVSTGAKTGSLAAVTAATTAAHSVAPTVVAKTAAPKHVAFSTMSNTVKATVGVAAGVKGSNLGTPTMAGPRILLPTGKRVAEDGKQALSGPIGSTKFHPTKTVALAATTKVVSLPKVNATPSVPAVPKVTPATTMLITVVKAKPAAQPKAQPKVAIVVPQPKAAQPATKVAVKLQPKAATKAVVQPKVQKASTAAVAKVTPAVKAVKTIAIGHGTKLATNGTYAISLNAKPVEFDAVKPRVENNVPLTPFRYLFEQSGGKVAWTNKTKSVTANGQGKDVYIKIGDKLAKVNNLPVELDLTPFIENGRTIVPLSFIKDALDVEVDYDPVTNHVLITSIKKKK